jgi:hypothetical protein
MIAFIVPICGRKCYTVPSALRQTNTSEFPHAANDQWNSCEARLRSDVLFWKPCSVLRGQSSALSLSVADDLVTRLHPALSPHSFGSSPQPKSLVMSPAVGHHGAWMYSRIFVRSFRWTTPLRPNGLVRDALSTPASIAERPKFDAMGIALARGATEMTRSASIMRRSEMRMYNASKGWKLKLHRCEMK